MRPLLEMAEQTLAAPFLAVVWSISVHQTNPPKQVARWMKNLIHESGCSVSDDPILAIPTHHAVIQGCDLRFPAAPRDGRLQLPSWLPE